MGRGRSLKKIGYTSCCILLLLVSKVVPQDSRQFIGRNLCAERTNGTTTDNLSCLDNNECFPRAQLCDGVNNCVDGSDEGIGNAAIICDPTDLATTGTNFRCGNSQILPLDQICDGTADCQSGEDETNSICDNKCLLVHYGGCDEVEVCETSRNSLNCAGCIDGFAPIITNGVEACEMLLSLNFENTTVSGPEGGVAELCVVLNIPANISRTASALVELTFANGTAFSGIDFFPPSPANFTLDSDMHRQCINVALASDRFVDGQKFFTSEITTPSLSSQQVVIGAPANVIITDNDTAAFAFTDETFTTMEESRQMVVMVELVDNVVLTEDAVLYVIIELDTNASADGAAIITGNDADLNLPTNLAFMVMFLANSAQFDWQSVTIVVVDDNFIENAETFRLVLARTLDATGTILDEAIGEIQQNDDPQYGFPGSTYLYVEQDGIEDLTLEITNGVVFMSGSTVMRVVVVTTADGTAIGGVDYVSINMAVTFSVNNGLTQTIPLTIQDDEIIESTEDLSVIATAVLNVEGKSAIIYLLDDDLVEFHFVNLLQTMDEVVGVVQICVRLVAGILTNPVTVTLRFASGSATAPQDFDGTTGTLVFDNTNIPGTNSAIRCLNRNIVDDTLVERTESFTVIGSGANFITGDTAEIFILDNDQVVFKIIPSSVVVEELDNVSASIVVRLASISGVLTFPISIDLQTVEGTARENRDFIAMSEMLVIQAGAQPGSSLPFSVPIIVNPEVENQEFFTIEANIQANGGFTSGSSMATVNVTINDLDSGSGSSIVVYAILSTLIGLLVMALVSTLIFFAIKRSRKSIQKNITAEVNFSQTENTSYGIAMTDSCDEVEEEDHTYESVM